MTQKTTRPALVCFGALTLITGVAYPLAVTAIGRVLFPFEASGSVIERNGGAVASALLGQPFTGDRYFWPRPSATSPVPYSPFSGDPLAGSSGSNAGPTNPTFLDTIKERVSALRKAHGDGSGPIPGDLATASASGLDPHISPAAAEFQAARVSKARGIPETDVRALITSQTESRQFGFLGEPRVNVLVLNLALDALSGRH